MGSSYCNLLHHVVFSTKGREPWLTPTIRPRIHQYLGGAIRDEGGIAFTINGTADHVHILADCGRTKPLPK
ncbi:MAG: transposase [Chthoniobacterales bacterium]|nr:transposase [Chthoniobacterales bacterium]